MTREERGRLIRDRFRATAVAPFAGGGFRKLRPEPQPRKKIYMPWPEIVADNIRRYEWMVKPDPPKPIGLNIKRTARPLPLCLIAIKLSVKKIRLR